MNRKTLKDRLHSMGFNIKGRDDTTHIISNVRNHYVNDELGLHIFFYTYMNNTEGKIANLNYRHGDSSGIYFYPTTLTEAVEWLEKNIDRIRDGK